MNFPLQFNRGRNKKEMAPLARYGIEENLRANFGRFLTKAADHELFRANPRDWAVKLGVDEAAILNLMVAAAAEGIVDLIWQTDCPVCKYYGRAATSLGGVTGLHNCPNCDHTYEAHLDEEIQVTVSVSEKIRPLSPAKRDDMLFRTLVDEKYGPVSGFRLINLPAFRELLTRQILPEGQSLGVKRLAVFFSDLRGSTALYERVGDAQAYAWVCEHFRVIFDAATRNHGTAVKTIGDGVMGVFADPKDALQGLAEVLRDLKAMNGKAGLTDENQLILKVGMHVGPCIVVTLNGRLDYFGKTVNVAARLSELSTGGDLVLSHAVLAQPDICHLAEEVGQIFPLAARLRGLQEPFALHRLVIPSSTTATVGILGSPA
jgi:class 3 adenylate cyclase